LIAEGLATVNQSKLRASGNDQVWQFLLEAFVARSNEIGAIISDFDFGTQIT